MADTMQFDLVSPERSLASFAATEVQIPGADGDMTAMPDHSPVTTTLRPGLLTVKADGAEHAFVVTGGFAEVTPAGVTVLAEQAMAQADVTADDVATLVADAEASVAGKTEADLDRANKTLADVKAVGTALGF